MSVEEIVSGLGHLINGEIVGREVGFGDRYCRFLRERLFDPIGAQSARP